MTISVIVPIYKVEAYLAQCIDSIIHQSYHDLEIILVDDGSPDRCPALCDQYADQDSRIKVIHKQNAGLIAARKSGVENATGDYITFVDGDDWIAPTMYAKMVEAIEQYQADCAISQFYFAYEDHHTSSHYLLERPYYDRAAMEAEIFPTMLYSGKWYQFGIFPNCWTKLFRADILRKHIFDVDDRIRLGEDIAFTYPCLMDCQSVAFIDEALYYYRQNPTSMTASYDPRLSQIYLLPYQAVKKASEELSVNLSPQLPYYLLYLINFVIRNEALPSNDKKTVKRSNTLKALLLSGKEIRCLKLSTLPLHIKLLFLAINFQSALMLSLYRELMKKHINNR